MSYGRLRVRLAIGLAITAIAFAIAGNRIFYLFRIARSGQPAPERLKNIPRRLGVQFPEVFGQRKLLKWSVPGIAHFFVFWGFLILNLTLFEAYASLFDKNWAGFGQEA